MDATGHNDDADDEVIFVSSHISDNAATEDESDPQKPSNSDSSGDSNPSTVDPSRGSAAALTRMSNKIQRKRTHSDAGFSITKGPIECPKFLVLHLNVLCDGRAGLIHTITTIFKDLLPQMKPPAAIDILSAFAASPILETVLKMLTHDRISARETIICTQAYMRIFDRDALDMMSLYDDVKSFLRMARANGVTTMLQTDLLHKAEALINDPEVINLFDLFVDTKRAYLNTHTDGPGRLVPLGNTNIMKAYARDYIEKKKLNGEMVDESIMQNPKRLLPPSQVMVLSCVPYGLKSAKGVGAKACWIKKCEVIPPHDVKIDYVVDSLADLGKEIFKKRQKVDVKPVEEEVKREEPVLKSIEADENLPEVRKNYEEPEVEDTDSSDLSDVDYGLLETMERLTQVA
ncbi:hypothetical protein QBC38DRAFT_523810 [Podospora fimiseda]|uniref:Uncharacterized protein n=1 Tax=Podospora fimiseda TaxID=252190 RepID=A0AAN7H5P6_9PEZI|nr:hypothetical protein QBC38DRAFT_523810 [Podospora fimiseda]